MLQENEDVVRGALAEFSADFELEYCLPEWRHRGIGSFPESKMCVRTEARRDSTQVRAALLRYDFLDAVHACMLDFAKIIGELQDCVSTLAPCPHMAQ